MEGEGASGPALLLGLMLPESAMRFDLGIEKVCIQPTMWQAMGALLLVSMWHRLTLLTSCMLFAQAKACRLYSGWSYLLGTPNAPVTALSLHH